MRHFVSKFGLGLAICFGTMFRSVSASVSVATYPLANGNEVPSTMSPDITAGNISFSTNASDFTGSGNSMGFKLASYRSTEATAAPDSYFQFTLTPNTGESMDLSSLSFTASYPNDPLSYFALRSSLDGDTSDLLTAYISASGTETATLGSSFSDLTTPVTFEVITWNTNRDINVIAYYSNLTVNGTTSAVPEPASLAVIGIPAATALLRRRRRMI